MLQCKTCGEISVVGVAEKNGINFYACCNDECKVYAELLVETNGHLEDVHKMLSVYKDVIKEITDEKNRVR
jgi:hypothetical protein